MSFSTSSMVRAFLLALTKADVGLSLVDNTSDATKPISAAQQAALDVRMSLPVFAFPSGTYITANSRASTFAQTADVFRAFPFFVPQTLTITRIGGEITVIGNVGSKLRLGIYGDNGAGKPGALVVDAGQINGDSATVQEIVLGSSLVLTRGWYWAGGASQSVSTPAPTVRSVDSAGPVGSGGGGFLLDLGTSLPVAGVTSVGYSMTSVSGALPANFTIAGQTGSAPRLFFKLA